MVEIKRKPNWLTISVFAGAIAGFLLAVFFVHVPRWAYAAGLSDGLRGLFAMSFSLGGGALGYWLFKRCVMLPEMSLAPSHNRTP
jgi:hypothetical protein